MVLEGGMTIHNEQCTRGKADGTCGRTRNIRSNQASNNSEFIHSFLECLYTVCGRNIHSNQASNNSVHPPFLGVPIHDTGYLARTQASITKGDRVYPAALQHARTVIFPLLWWSHVYHTQGRLLLMDLEACLSRQIEKLTGLINQFVIFNVCSKRSNNCR